MLLILYRVNLCAQVVNMVQSGKEDGSVEQNIQIIRLLAK